jgi:predicted porin
MKKHLIAAAVAAAVAAPVMAQNVSVSGYIETGIESAKTTGSNSTTTISAASFGSSNLKFTGSEDLGGGLKAGFRLEQSLDVKNGTGGSSTLGVNATTGSLFNRGSELNLSGAFGTVKVGKLDHPGIEGNEVQYVGNIALFESEVEGDTGSGSTASDANGTIIYSTPAINGFTVTAGFTGKDNGTAASAVVAHEGITSVQLAGKIGGLDVKIGGGSIKYNAGKDKVTGFGFGYDLGVAQVSLNNQKLDRYSSNADRTETVAAVKVPLGNGFDARLAFSSYDISGTTTGDANKTTVALAKALSKRTNVYTMYRKINTEGSADTTEMGVYVGHSF